jgi:hypothetical protein
MIEIFTNTYPEFVELKNYLEGGFVKNTNFKESKGVFLKISEDPLDTVIFFEIKKEMSLRRSNFGKGKSKRSSYILKVPVDKGNTSKFRSSIGPNLIHRIDSEININVLLECKKNDIQVIPSHDCFVTSARHEPLVKKIYFQCFKNIIFKIDILNAFFSANCNNYTSLKSDAKKIVIKCSERRKDIYDMFKKGEILVSPDILTP